MSNLGAVQAALLIICLSVSAAFAGGPLLKGVPDTPPDDKGTAESATKLGWPMCGRRTAGFGYLVDPFTGRVAFHAGQDLAADFGTPVRAAEAGEVREAERRGPYGLMIEIDHLTGLVTRYGQLQRILVKRGDRVLAGEQVATVGSSGRSTGPHLHFEVWRRGRVEDPTKHLPPHSECAGNNADKLPKLRR
jgi:murein DD-endopeptidase MepM/ murein hydrolase activator NlpD